MRRFGDHCINFVSAVVGCLSEHHGVADATDVDAEAATAADVWQGLHRAHESLRQMLDEMMDHLAGADEAEAMAPMIGELGGSAAMLVTMLKNGKAVGATAADKQEAIQVFLDTLLTALMRLRTIPQSLALPQDTNVPTYLWAQALGHLKEKDLRSLPGWYLKDSAEALKIEPIFLIDERGIPSEAPVGAEIFARPPMRTGGATRKWTNIGAGALLGALRDGKPRDRIAVGLLDRVLIQQVLDNTDHLMHTPAWEEAYAKNGGNPLWLTVNITGEFIHSAFGGTCEQWDKLQDTLQRLPDLFGVELSEGLANALDQLPNLASLFAFLGRRPIYLDDNRPETSWFALTYASRQAYQNTERYPDIKALKVDFRFFHELAQKRNEKLFFEFLSQLAGLRGIEKSEPLIIIEGVNDDNLSATTAWLCKYAKMKQRPLAFQYYCPDLSLDTWIPTDYQAFLPQLVRKVR